MAEADAIAAVGLRRIPAADLQALARGEVPAALPGPHAQDALPPAFVAVRALGLQAEAAARGDAGGLAGAVFYIVHGDAVVGSCGFKDAALDGWVEIGYGLAPAHQRQGLGTQAVAALCALAFASGSVGSVRACIEPANAASNALARRLGFVPGAMVTEEDGSCVRVWTLS
jgi:RimJ/RimL family protein N-acetyltransferase